MSNRIHSKGPRRYEEHNAGNGEIYPGMLLELAADGSVYPHGLAGGIAEALVAEEDALQGKVVTDLFTADNPVPCLLPTKGGEVNMLIKDGQAISKGEILMSNGDGTLVALPQESASLTVEAWPVAVAQEAASPSGADVLAAVRIL